MSSNAQPLSGAERIRSLTDEDAIFHAFDSYPWKKDKTFISGLYAILGNPSDNPQASPNDMATHARIFYYAQKIGVTIDFGRYQTWLANHPDHKQPDVLPDEYAPKTTSSSEAAASPLEWQKAAPKADLYIDKKNQQDQPQGGAEGQPSYPMGFADMIKLLQEGKPVPGIRQIPNTIVRDPSVKPVGSMTAPRKPWGKNIEPQVADLDINKALDSEFPPVEADSKDSSQPTEAQSA